MKGEYGEPWRVACAWCDGPREDDHSECPADGDDYTNLIVSNGVVVGRLWEEHPCARIVACVNALDGLDPAKLATFLEAAKVLSPMRPDGNTWVKTNDVSISVSTPEPVMQFWAAYDALTGEAPNA